MTKVKKSPKKTKKRSWKAKKLSFSLSTPLSILGAESDIQQLKLHESQLSNALSAVQKRVDSLESRSDGRILGFEHRLRVLEAILMEHGWMR